MNNTLVNPVVRMALDELRGLESGAERFDTDSELGRIAWRRWGGGGDNLLLVHGGFGSWMHWVRVLPLLAPRYTLWTPDLPGFGDSGLVGPPQFDLVDVGRALADGFRSLAGAQAKLSLVGFSLGNRIVPPVARELGADAVRHVVLVAPGSFWGRMNTTTAKWRGLDDAEALMAAHRRNLEIIMFADPSRIDDLAVKVQMVNTARVRANPPLDRLRLLNMLDGFPFGLSAIWGDRDAYHLGGPDRRTESLSPIDRGIEIRVVPDAGHWVMYEQPQAFSTALQELLQAPVRPADPA